MNQCIRCIDCDEVFMRSCHDQCREYQYDPNHSTDPLQTVEKDDFQDFLITHHGHRLEYLDIIADSFVSESPYSEPIKTSYFRATNKKEKFVIKRFRESIEEPIKCQLIAGDYLLECQGVEIQSEEIVQQLKAEFKRYPLSQTQLSTFLKLYRRIVETIDVKNLERISEESCHPLEIYYRMDDTSLFCLLRNCRNIFKGKEYSDIEEFILHHKDDGVLLLKARYKIHVTKREETKVKAVPKVVSAEVKKVQEKK